MVTYPEDWTPMQLKDLGYIQMCRRIFQSQTKAYGAIPFYKISTFGGKLMHIFRKNYMNSTKPCIRTQKREMY